MQAFQRDLSRFEKLNAQVLGVSSDSLETHRKFSQEYDITFPLIADDGTLKNLYGSRRITYVIDQSQIIRSIQIGVPDNDKLLEALEKLP
ncbi:hypothetical protein DESUT3_20180 [Desulfuromonas versatilis]|uniref:Alkyl hydroperoxide reductase subunit C/ Thiol specific antioxidant domain-containing protein n=1 Tax=Desulfuromonas versatilis TaxID=2802975 RepID=A0ABN6DYE6_9BACT|nr:redoxin domain-containing protein [Desulfuromonas versatilis]BCR04949.1 hypothetical protein DESUT3_20180 [Desulfuromonas versatilis]